jgi:hypothetical protein
MASALRKAALSRKSNRGPNVTARNFRSIVGGGLRKSVAASSTRAGRGKSGSQGNS